MGEIPAVAAAFQVFRSPDWMTAVDLRLPGRRASGLFLLLTVAVLGLRHRGQGREREAQSKKKHVQAHEQIPRRGICHKKRALSSSSSTVASVRLAEAT